MIVGVVDMLEIALEKISLKSMVIMTIATEEEYG
jgi:hypothetical protein